MKPLKKSVSITLDEPILTQIQALAEKEEQWGVYTRAMARILGGASE